MSSHLTLGLPGSLWPVTTSTSAEPYARVQAPTLARWLGSAQTQSMDDDGCWSSWLMRALTEQRSDAAFAAVHAVHRGLDGAGTWLRADPVHLALGQEDVMLTAPHQLEISDDEAQQLVRDINAQCADDGWRLHIVSPRQWLLHVPQTLSVLTHDPWAGIDVPHRYVHPVGDDALGLRRWMTEVQMVLFAHPLNAAREARGARAINSVWPWASGTMPLPKATAAAFATTCKQARALADALKIPDATPSSRNGRTVAYIPDLMHAYLNVDGERWRDALHRVDTEVLAPLASRYDGVDIVLGGQRPTRVVQYASPNSVQKMMRVFRSADDAAVLLAKLADAR